MVCLVIKMGEPDTQGLEYWLNELSNNITREDMIKKFIGSNEFYYLANRYGVGI